MTYNPYEILGVKSTSTIDEIAAVFNEKKAELTRLILLEGDAGNIAAEQLQRLKEAYEDIRSLKGADALVIDENKRRPLGRIEDLVKQGELIEAQKLLDAQYDRSAEWHYVQAALYYKQGWLMESRKQLEIARRMAPEDEKYAKALRGLLNTVNYGHPHGTPIEGNKLNEENPTCCNVCGELIMTDCCCDFRDKEDK